MLARLTGLGEGNPGRVSGNVAPPPVLTTGRGPFRAVRTFRPHLAKLCENAYFYRKSVPYMKRTLLCLLLAACCATACTSRRAKNVEAAPEPLVRFETTLGNFTLKLYNETPVHRDNFLRLVHEGFYDSILFHRVIASFMVQAGDPESRHAADTASLGLVDIGYALPAEFRPGLYHKRGALAAARQGDDVNPERESSGSQFYIVTGRRYTCEELHDLERQRNASIVDTLAEAPLHFTEAQLEAYTTQGGAPHLDGRYTVFGEVVEGMDVVTRIEQSATNAADRPLTNVRILKTEVVDPASPTDKPDATRLRTE